MKVVLEALTIMGLVSAPLVAQTTNAAPSPTAPPSSTAQGKATTPADATMNTIVVSAVPAGESVLPTARPISSIYGQDMSIVDTPRSVSIITKQQIEDRQITSVQDLGQFSSGTYTPALYGLDGIPNIRGIAGSLYQNGQQEIYYVNSVVPSFNQMESLDLVKGPGSTVYGPSGGGMGGYVNFITKAPEFDGFHNQIETTIGSYSPGNQSWGHYEWAVDSTGPLIKDKLAYRVSYEGVDGDTYYRNTRDEKQDGFLALTYLPYDSVKMDWTAQYYEVRDNEVNGFTRPTQSLINNGQYEKGPVSGYGSEAAPDDYYTDPKVVDPTGTQKVYGYESLNGPQDSARGDKFTTQLITSIDVDTDTKIVDYQFYEHLESQKNETYGYDEYVPGINLYDTRIELHHDYTFNLFGHEVQNHDVGGAAFRAQWGKEFSDFTIEPYNYYDITQNPSTFNIANYPDVIADGAGGTYGGYAIKGQKNYSAGLFYDADLGQFTSGNTGEYHVSDTGVFYQHQTDWTKSFTTILGGRADYVDAESRVPTQDLVGYTDPSDYGSGTRVVNYSAFASAIYKLTKDSSVYFTFDRTHGFQGDSNFGGLTAGPNQVDPAELRNQSDLYEAGYKSTFFNNTLYASIDGFYQTRIEEEQGGPPAEVETRGVEADVSYQPDRHWAITGNFTWMEANYHQIAPYEQTGDYLDAYPTTATVDGKSGTGLGSPNYATFPTGNYEVPGTPKIYFNAFLVYKFDNGFGLGVGPQVTGEQNANITGSLVIPAQFTWNAEIFYRKPKWEAQINFFNFTDERNFIVSDPTFTGNDSIIEQMPLHISGTFKYRF